MSRVCDAGVALHEDVAVSGNLLLPVDVTHVIVVPLALYEERCGALYIERNADARGFTANECDLVAALAPQVSATLELARLLEEREQLEADLRRAQRMEAVGQLASGIAHDFNNMLTAIRSSLELLGGSESAEDRDESIATIFAAYERAAELTRQLLAFSRRQVLEAEVIDLGAAVDGLRGILRQLVGPSIAIDIVLPATIVKVRTDRSSLEQAIVNLVANARDAMTDGGRLRIGVSEVMLDETWLVRGAVSTGPHACIDVTDTGAGMPREILDKIFEPFFTTKSVGQGTGLGLASVHGFVMQAGGHIEVTSEIGEGSSFRIYLPASAEETITVPTERPAVTRPGLVSILVVDDDHLVRRSVATALGHQGYTVYDVPNGQAAIAHIQGEGAVDLVVTDVVMPVMSGPELANQLERAGIRIPILFISGYPSGDLVDQGVLRSGVEYLRKPFAIAELIERIRAMLPQQAANVGTR
jgi:signal transduction histidine kinase/ActR/RegA family two-component response regulator